MRVLIVLTRMSATKGGDNDEFARVWADAHAAGEDCLLFGASPPTPDCAALVIHGHGYSDLALTDADIDRALRDIETHLREKQLAKAGVELAVVFHPSTAWSMKDASRLTRALMDSGLGIGFVRRYRLDSPLVKVLVPACRSGRDFSAEFDKMWAALRSTASTYRNPLDHIVKLAMDSLMPLVTRLGEWKETGFDEREGERAFLKREKVTAEDVRRALKIIDGESLKSLIDELVGDVLKEPAGAEGRLGIEAARDKVRAYFDDRNELYPRVRKIINILEEGGDAPAATKLAELKTQVGGDDALHAWLSGLVTELINLKGKVLGYAAAAPQSGEPSNA